MTEEQLSHLDELALQYARGDLDVLYDLVNLMKPIIANEARRWGNDCQNGITADFYSEFQQAVWEAADGYNGSSRFLQRYYHFLKRRGLNHKRKLSIMRQEFYKYYQSLKDGDKVEDAKAALQVENEVITRQMVTDFLAKVDDQTALIIWSLIYGYTNNEIAECLGEHSYSAKVRKKVQRARDKFREHMEIK